MSAAPTEEEVLAFVRDNPDSTARAIAEGLGTRASRVSPILRDLRAAGEIASGGKNTRGRTWRYVGA
jgi:DNA-binding MarR family transcriptional regulator